MRSPVTRNPLAGIAFETFAQVEDSDNADNLKWTTRLITPDTGDIKSFNCSLVMDSVGSFSITLDNKNQQFFRNDELETLEDGTTALEDFCTKKTITEIGGAPIEAKELFTRFKGNWTKGSSYFRPMMLVKIFARNHFLFTDSANVSNIFTGVVSSVTDRFSGGVYEVTLQGESILKWLQLSNVLVNPALASLQDQDEGISRGIAQGYFDFRDLFTTRFAGRTPEELMKELILGRILEGEDGEDVRVGGIATYALEASDTTEEAQRLNYISQYNRIFERRDHGALRELFDVQKLHIHPTDTELDEIARVEAYAEFLKRSIPGVTGHEFRTRLSLCQDVARAIYWEFYADGDGDLWFHPPLLDIQRFLLQKNREVYVLDDESRIAWDITHSDRSIATRTEVTPEIDMVTFNLDIEQLAFTNFYEDEARIPIYGRRTDQIKTPLVKNFKEAGQFAELHQTRKNFKDEKTASLTMPFRPELRLARPFYVPQRNMMFNIHSVSHNYGIGGTAQTTLGLNYGRKPWDDLTEILGFEAKSEADIKQKKLNQSKTTEIKVPRPSGG